MWNWNFHESASFMHIFFSWFFHLSQPSCFCWSICLLFWCSLTSISFAPLVENCRKWRFLKCQATSTPKGYLFFGSQVLRGVWGGTFVSKAPRRFTKLLIDSGIFVVFCNIFRLYYYNWYILLDLSQSSFLTLILPQSLKSWSIPEQGMIGDNCSQWGAWQTKPVEVGDQNSNTSG